MHGERTVRDQLDFACRLADALLESATIDALSLVDELELATAVFVVGERSPHVANAAWRRLGAAPGRFDSYIAQALQTGASLHVPTLQFESTGRHLAATLRPSRGALRAHVTVACIEITNEATTDAHDRLLAQLAEADNASRLKDQFLAVVLHELRAPLTTIVLWEGVLRDETADPALRAKAHEAIRQSALAQSRVVSDLLDVSRAIAGKLHIDTRPVDIGRVVREAIESFAPAALEKQIAIEHRDIAKTEVDGDAIRLRQVLDNLLSNALKFTDSGGHIRVAVTRRGRAIAIEVSDTGQGIAAELLPTIFDPFMQSENITTRRAGGLGLGLAIVQQLVGLHGGTVVAASDGPGRGAKLTVTLRAAGARRRSTPPLGVAVVDLHRTRVLVIDDDQRVLDALAVLLDRVGAVVETADSAEAGRARIANNTTDVIVCDIAMPGEDGYSFIRGLRAVRNRVAAIALTAYASESDIERALAAGFDRHLAKPIDFERLVENIDALAPRELSASK